MVRLELGTLLSPPLALPTPQPVSGPGGSAGLWGMVCTWKSHGRGLSPPGLPRPHRGCPAPTAAPHRPRPLPALPPAVSDQLPRRFLALARAAPRTPGRGLLLAGPQGRRHRTGRPRRRHRVSVPAGLRRPRGTVLVPSAWKVSRKDPKADLWGFTEASLRSRGC